LLVPIAISIAYYLSWRHEVDSAGGDPQPDLVKAEGVGVVVLAVVAILTGWIFRRTRRDGKDR
jgi:hypothetical protein